MIQLKRLRQTEGSGSGGAVIFMCLVLGEQALKRRFYLSYSFLKVPDYAEFTLSVFPSPDGESKCREVRRSKRSLRRRNKYAGCSSHWLSRPPSFASLSKRHKRKVKCSYGWSRRGVTGFDWADLNDAGLERGPSYSRLVYTSYKSRGSSEKVAVVAGGCVFAGRL